MPNASEEREVVANMKPVTRSIGICPGHRLMTLKVKVTRKSEGEEERVQ